MDNGRWKLMEVFEYVAQNSSRSNPMPFDSYKKIPFKSINALKRAGFIFEDWKNRIYLNDRGAELWALWNTIKWQEKMKLINLRKNKYSVGNKVQIIKMLIIGGLAFNVGDEGIIKDIVKSDFVDFGLFNISILTINFNGKTISVGHPIADDHMIVI